MPAAPQMWVFAYGSLIWNPDFPVVERRVATAHDWRRSFCMWSVHYRGTAEAPGLVLALDAERGARCQGVAFRVAPGHEAATLALLRARELVSSAYLETRLRLTSAEGEIEALAYVIDPDHPQYCPARGLEEQAQIIACAVGTRGPNRDYLFETVRHLAALGIADPELEELSQRVAAMGA